MIVHRCPCGQRYTLPEWLTLPYGWFEDHTQEGGVHRLEIRQCKCGSHRSIDIDELSGQLRALLRGEDHRLPPVSEAREVL